MFLLSYCFFVFLFKSDRENEEHVYDDLLPVCSSKISGSFQEIQFFFSLVFEWFMFLSRLSKSPLFVFLVKIHRSKNPPVTLWQLTNRRVSDIWRATSETAYVLPRTQTSLFWWTLMKMCGSSPVTRYALASAMRKTTRMRRRLAYVNHFFPPEFIIWFKWSSPLSLLRTYVTSLVLSIPCSFFCEKDVKHIVFFYIFCTKQKQC